MLTFLLEKSSLSNEVRSSQSHGTVLGTPVIIYLGKGTFPVVFYCRVSSFCHGCPLSLSLPLFSSLFCALPKVRENEARPRTPLTASRHFREMETSTPLSLSPRLCRPSACSTHKGLKDKIHLELEIILHNISTTLA